MSLIELAETGWIPDFLIRRGIRRLLNQRLTQSGASSPEPQQMARFAAELRNSPLAVETAAANRQHYEVPAEFYQAVLGPRMKYSACLFDTPQTTLAEAEESMLHQTCTRAELADGMRVLELGCGWGSLTLWMAEHYPHCKITALSNSASQRAFIEAKARQQGLSNVQVITADMRDFDTDATFDRVVSVEMFEHMRNYELLLRRVADWLTPQGKAFVHIFCHRTSPYLFETEGANNWMGRHFFTGGMMPAERLFDQFPDDLKVEQQWRVNGMHYWRTCEAWLNNLDRHRSHLQSLFAEHTSPAEAARCVQRWRMFFMACAELFRFAGGEEWFVAHYRFQPTKRPARRSRELMHTH